MIKTKKLAFSAVTVRQLTQNMSDEQLREVAGGYTRGAATAVCGASLSNDANLCGNTRPTNTIVNPTTNTSCNCQSNGFETAPQC
jgi:hypothetical protein